MTRALLASARMDQHLQPDEVRKTLPTRVSYESMQKDGATLLMPFGDDILFMQISL